MKAILTVGISASGKTTFAEGLVEKGWRDINRDWIRFNLVKPGANWSNYKFNRTNEDKVTELQGKMIMEAWADGKNIIISDTNLSAKTRANLTKKLNDLGYTVELEVFQVAMNIAMKRDRLRPNSVGHEIMYKQNLLMNDFIGRLTYLPDESLPKAIIVDVDGTIAKMDGRGPFEWSRVGEDLPRWFVIDMVINYARQGYVIIIVSGRSDECRAETLEWLDHHGVPFKELHMRREGDYRRDSAIKEEILWTHLAHRYNIEAAIDDRPMMIRTWHELKIPNVIAVADPYIEF